MKSKLFFLAIPIVLFSFLSTKGKHVEDNHKLVLNTINSEPLYRLLTKEGYHQYTSSKSHYHNLINAGRKPEGIIGYVFNQQVKDAVPVWYCAKLRRGRIWGEVVAADFLYTISKEEQLYAISNNGYENAQPDHIEFFMAATQLPGTTPLYRILQTQMNPIGHFLTSDANERNIILADAKNYRDEGIAGYIWTTQVSLPAQ